MNKFQDRTQQFLMEYAAIVDYNGFIFLDIHSKCSIWFRDFELIEVVGVFQTFMRCNICKTKKLIGEITFGRE